MDHNFKHLDKEALLNHFDGDMEMIYEIVEIFEETYAIHLKKLDQAIETEDHELFERAAHTLKGMVANFFSKDLVDQFYSLENKGKEAEIKDCSKDIESATKEIKELLVELKSLIKDINQ